MVCDGRELSRTTFAALFNVIGVRYGQGDTANTFNVPDFRDRNPIGASMMDSAGRAVTTVENPSGTTSGGEAKHTLTITEMPAHDHDMTHTHDLPTGSGSVGSPVFVTATSPSPSQVPTSAPSPQITSRTGGDAAHNVLDPYFAITYIVFAGP